MKKKEIGIISILVIVICLMIFNITKSNIENNNIKSITTNISASTDVLKENEEIILDIKLDVSDSLKDNTNIFRGKIEYDTKVFEELTLDDFNIKGSWSNFEYNDETKEFIILNLNSLKNTEDVMSISLKTEEEIPSIEKTSIGISKMETAIYNEDEEIIITNKDGNTLDEIILEKEKVEDKTSSTTTKVTNSTNETTTKNSSTTTSTTKTTTTSSKITTTSKNTTTTNKTTTTKNSTTKNTTTKSEVIVIPNTTKSTTKNITTTKKATTKKSTTSTTIKNTTSTASITTSTTTKENKSFFEKNNNANKKVLVIIIILIIILIAFAVYRYNKVKNINIFFILLLANILIASSIVNALTTLKGDIDNDGSITIQDIINLEKYLINLESKVNDTTRDSADLNDDGNISTIDLAILIHLMLEPEKDDNQTDSGPTAKEVLNEIKIGWNLGNSLDSTNYKKEYLGEAKNIEYYETLWGNPKTTKEIIDVVKKAGFNSIRVPVTYYDHILEDGTIDEAWFNRVEEVINYVLDNDLYCILDIHHDTGLYEGGSWIVADAGKLEENSLKLKNLWTQIANRFKDYDYKLVFEGLNETVDTNRQGYDWNSGTEITLNVMKLNQVFVDTVRSTGGKNKNRVLAITTYGGITDEHKLSLFTMPEDTVKDKIILALHDYADEEANIDKMMTRLKNYLVDKDIPVMLDEFGTNTNKGDDRRAEIASYYVSKAKSLNIPCFIWDDGGNYQVLDRYNLTWKYPKMKDALINAAYQK